ncbi:MAG: DUF502 domain-containing protein [Halobacteria archaeon]|nr:DUF502 domain-containing protein [Halobacteria archaeon]
MSASRNSIIRDVRNSFIAGLALVAPLAITIFVLRFIFNWITDFIEPFIELMGLRSLTAEEIVAQGLGVLILIFLLTILGYIATKSLGRRFFREFDEIMARLPLVSTIYSSVRQVSNALMDRRNRFESVVLVEWPRSEIYALGFVTNDSHKAIQKAVGKRMYNVYIPTSPNPTGGFLAMIPEDRIKRLDMSVRAGIQMLVTTGITDEEVDEIQDLQFRG